MKMPGGYGRDRGYTTIRVSLPKVITTVGGRIYVDLGPDNGHYDQSIKAEEVIDMPILVFREGLCVCDGRHRILNLLNNGYYTIDVVVKPEDAESMIGLIGD